MSEFQPVGAVPGVPGRVPPRFSIVTVCLNAGEALQQTVSSVIGQDFCDWELIVKDGGSTDGSLDLLPDDPRVKLHSCPDDGIYDSMNQAVELSSGDYLNFLNAGDTYRVESALSLVDRAVAGGDNEGRAPTVVYSDYFDLHRGKTVKMPARWSRYSAFMKSLCHQAEWFERSALVHAGGFDCQVKLRADHKLLLELMSCSDGRFSSAHIDRALVDYDGQGVSASLENRRTLDREMADLRRQYFSRFERLAWRGLLALRLNWLRRLARSLVNRGGR